MDAGENAFEHRGVDRHTVLAGNFVSGQWLPTFQPLGAVDFGNIQLSTSARIGYQHMGVNFNLPVPLSFFVGNRLLTTSPLDFKLLDGNMWTGGICVDARRNNVAALLSVEPNARKNVTVHTSLYPFPLGSGSVEWRGTGLEWWAIDGGGAVNLRTNVAIVGGMRIEHLSLELADPVDPTGMIRFLQAILGDRYSSDFLTKLWIPYFGIQFDGSNYKGKLLFSPVAWTDVKIPFRYLRNDIFVTVFENAQYHFKPNGLWLERELQYEMRPVSNLKCSLWFKGSWCESEEGGEKDTGLTVLWVFRRPCTTRGPRAAVLLLTFWQEEWAAHGHSEHFPFEVSCSCKVYR